MGVPDQLIKPKIALCAYPPCSVHGGFLTLKEINMPWYAGVLLAGLIITALVCKYWPDGENDEQK